MKAKNSIKEAAAKARLEKKADTGSKWLVQVPGTTKKWTNSPSDLLLLKEWIDTLGNYNESNIKQAISQMIAGEGKRSTNKYNNAPVQHASSGSGSGGSGACSLWFAEYPEYTLNLLAVGHHIESNTAKYEIDWTCGTDWPGGKVGATVGASGG